MVETLLTLDEAAKALRVHIRTLHQLLADGALLTVRVGRRRFVREATLNEFIATHEDRTGEPSCAG